MEANNAQEQEQKPFEKKQPTFVPLSELRPRQNCKNVYVQVISSEITEEERDGEKTQVAKGFVSDDSSYMPFIIRGDQAKLMNVGDVVAFRNLKAIILDGVPAITVDRWGKISQEPTQKENIKKPLTYFNTLKLQDFVPGEHNHNLNVKIQSITETKKRENRRAPREGEEQQDEYIYQVSGVAGDNTAKINFVVKGRNAKRIEVGKSFTFLNTLSSVLEETHTLESGDRGYITEYDEKNGAINIPEQAKDLSSQKYEKVIVAQQDNNKPQRKQSGDRNRNRNNDRNNNRNNNNNNRNRNNNDNYNNNQNNRNNNRNQNRNNDRNNNNNRNEQN